MIVNILEIQLQTVFYGDSANKILQSSVQATILGKNIFLADKSDNNVLYRRLIAKLGNRCNTVWARMQSQWKGKNCPSFSEEAIT